MGYGNHHGWQGGVADSNLPAIATITAGRKGSDPNLSAIVTDTVGRKSFDSNLPARASIRTGGEGF